MTNCQYATNEPTGALCAVTGRHVSHGVCRACDGNPGETMPPVCPPHATWCEKYGLPTGHNACAVCTEARRDWPDFAQHMRNVGRMYGAATCTHRMDTGRTVTRVCCGGKEHALPVYQCDRTGTEAACAKCRDKELIQQQE